MAAFLPSMLHCEGMLCLGLAAAANCGMLHSWECTCEGFWGAQALGSVCMPGTLDGVGRQAQAYHQHSGLPIPQ